MFKQQTPAFADGTSVSEYALILGLVVMITIPLLMSMGNTTRDSLNESAQGVSQIDQMTQLLTATAASGGTTTNPSATEAGAPTTGSNIVSIGPLNYQYMYGSNGQIQFSPINTPTSTSNNTTSVEGNVDNQAVMMQISQYLAELAKNPQDHPGITPEQLKDLSNVAQNLGNSQIKFDEKVTDKSKSNDNAKANKLQPINDNTQRYLELAKETQSDPVVNQLNQIILTISYQNYLKANSVLFNGEGNSKSEKAKNIDPVPEKFILPNVSNTANGQDTLQTADTLSNLQAR